MRFPKKSLGQNFLIDKNIIKKIIKLACLKNRNISKDKCREVITKFYNPNYMFQTFKRLISNNNPLI